MKICYLIQDFSLGGSTTVVYDLINNAPATDTVYLLLFFDIFDPRYSQIKSRDNVKIIFLHKTKTIDFKFLKLLKKTVKSIEPDIISCHLSCIFYLSLVYNLKKSTVFHTIHNRPKKDLPLVYRLALLRKIRNRDICLISCGESVKIEAEKYYKVPVYNIQNGIDTSNAVKTIDSTSDDITFISIGRFTKVKAVDNVIKAFNLAHKRTGRGKLLICGYGPEEESLKKLINDNNLSECVSIFGKTNNVEEYYRRSQVFCLLSQREGSPIVLLESMKFGLCAIGSNVQGTRDLIIDGQTGFLVEYNDVNAAAEKMILLMNDKMRLLEMRKSALKNVTNFDVSKMVKSYYNLFTMQKKEF